MKTGAKIVRFGSRTTFTAGRSTCTTGSTAVLRTVRATGRPAVMPIRNFFQMRRAGKGFDALNLVLNFV